MRKNIIIWRDKGWYNIYGSILYVLDYIIIYKKNKIVI